MPISNTLCVQCVLLLVMVFLYFLFLRLAVPLNSWYAVAAEGMASLCDIATFTCCVIAVKTPPTSASKM